MSEEDAKGWYHLFMSAIYFTPFLGAILSIYSWANTKRS